MDLVTLLAIAVGLAMDAFAVSIASSVSLGRVTGRQVFRLSSSFGLFQALMPVAGWAMGLTFVGLVAGWDHWLAFGLLAFVGCRAIWQSLKADGERRDCQDPTTGINLLLLSVATSIDALAVGLSFAAMKLTILVPVLVIGAVAAAFTVAGMLLGCRLGSLFGRRMEFAGGLILIGIGIKIALEHMNG